MPKRTDASASTATPNAASKTLDTLKNFDFLPDSAFVREPVVMALFACSHATVWNYVRRGKLPQPKRISARHTVWCVGELRAARRAIA